MSRRLDFGNLTVLGRLAVAAWLLAQASCAQVLGLEEAGHPGAAGTSDHGTSKGGTTSSQGGASGGDDDRPSVAGTAGQGGTADQAEVGTLGLTELRPSSGVLDPAFSPDVHDYHLRVGIGTSALHLTPTAGSAADVVIEGEHAASGAPSQPITLPLGNTAIEVTALDLNRERQRYVVTVERATALLDEAYIKASNGRENDHFGVGVAISEGTLAVGAPLEDGVGVGVDGDATTTTVDGNTGAVYVFVKTPTGWQQQGYLKPANPASGSGFGTTLALRGDTLVVGAPGEASRASGVDGNMNDPCLDPNAVGGSVNEPCPAPSGAAYVFERRFGHWAQSAYLKASDSQPASSFGTALALSDNALVVGAPNHSISAAKAINASGAAYVFERGPGGWFQSALLQAAHPDNYDYFGTAVAMRGDTVVVGAPGESSSATVVNGDDTNNGAVRSGAAYVFKRDHQGYKQTTYLKPTNTRADATFGSSVALDGAFVAVGAPGESSSGRGVDSRKNDADAPYSGAVYVFAAAGETYEQAAYLKASNADAEDVFGSALAFDGGVLAVAACGASYGNGSPAFGEDGLATGVGGAAGNDDAKQSGAVYLFSTNDGAWQQLAYVKASNAEAKDFFGRSLALADGDLAVGAEMESGGWAEPLDPSDNSVKGSGAVYVRGVLSKPPDQGPGALGLAALEIVGLSESLQFDRDGHLYRLATEASRESISIRPEAADPDARVRLVDVAGAPREDWESVPLQPGDNAFELEVTAGSGATVSYELHVLRPTAAQQSLVDVVAESPLIYSDGSLTVDLSGDTLVVGVPGDDRNAAGVATDDSSDAGAVIVFERKDGAWKEQAVLKASNAGRGHHFGAALDLDGDTLVVGADTEDSDAVGINQTGLGSTMFEAGAAYVFVRHAGVWTQQAYVKAPNASQGYHFGAAVALEGDRIVVGSPRECSDAQFPSDVQNHRGSRSGAAYVYQRVGESWSLESYLKPFNTVEGETFGSSVAIHGELIAVGAPKERGSTTAVDGSMTQDGDETGAVYTFRYGGGGWLRQSYLKPASFQKTSDFGRSVAVGDNIVAVGTPGDHSRARYVNGDQFDVLGGGDGKIEFDESIIGNGSVTIFEPVVGPPRNPEAQGWRQVAYLKASNSDAHDAFGKVLALSGDYLVVGAPSESNGDVAHPDDNSADGSGAAYLFHRGIGGWSESAYLKPDNVFAGAGFGCHVALDGPRVASGNCFHLDSGTFDQEHHGKAAVFDF